MAILNKKECLKIFYIFITVLIVMLIINHKWNSLWILDNIISIIFLILIVFLRSWIKLTRMGFVLLNLALITHNLGMFGFYEFEFFKIGYDNIVHFFSSFVAAYILFNFIAKKLHVRKSKKYEHSIISEHKIILIFLVISSVSLLGTCVELVEYFGYSYLGVGDGILFFGSGDTDIGEFGAGEYTDVMNDIFVNILGSIFGVMYFYYFKYKK